MTSSEEFGESADAWEPLHANESGGVAGAHLRLTPYDRPMRRALWMQWVRGTESPYRYSVAPAGVPRCLHLRAGREGDDAALTLREGDVLTAQTLDALTDLLLTVRFGLEDVERLARCAWGDRAADQSDSDRRVELNQSVGGVDWIGMTARPKGYVDVEVHGWGPCTFHVTPDQATTIADAFYAVAARAAGMKADRGGR